MTRKLFKRIASGGSQILPQILRLETSAGRRTKEVWGFAHKFSAVLTLPLFFLGCGKNRKNDQAKEKHRCYVDTALRGFAWS